MSLTPSKYQSLIPRKHAIYAYIAFTGENKDIVTYCLIVSEVQVSGRKTTIKFPIFLDITVYCSCLERDTEFSTASAYRLEHFPSLLYLISPSNANYQDI